MLKEITANISWIELLLLGILVRALYIGYAKGVRVELFKTAGLFFAIFLTLHYYVKCARVLRHWVVGPESIVQLFSFGLIFLLIILIFKVTRDACLVIFKIEESTDFDKWLGMILASVRGTCLCSMLVLMIFVSGIPFLTHSAQKSIAAQFFVGIAPGIYKATFESVVQSLFIKEELNQGAFIYKRAGSTKK